MTQWVFSFFINQSPMTDILARAKRYEDEAVAMEKEILEMVESKI
ncbi:MAG: hypothetical protein ACI97X_001665 [Oceanospirillaceae bacterium]|jgi:hypothetical protein